MVPTNRNERSVLFTNSAIETLKKRQNTDLKEENLLLAGMFKILIWTHWNAYRNSKKWSQRVWARMEEWDFIIFFFKFWFSVTFWFLLLLYLQILQESLIDFSNKTYKHKIYKNFQLFCLICISIPLSF